MRSGLRPLCRVAGDEPFRHCAGIRRQDHRRGVRREQGGRRDVPRRGEHADELRQRRGAGRRGLGPFADRLSAQLPRLFPGLPASGHPAETDRGGRLRPKRRFVRHHALFRRVCRRSAAPHVLRGADRFSVCRVAALGREEHGLFDRHLPPPARPD